MFGVLNRETQQRQNDKIGKSQPLERIPKNLDHQRWADEFKDKTKDGESLTDGKPGVCACPANMAMTPCIEKYSQRQEQGKQIRSQVEKFFAIHNNK